MCSHDALSADRTEEHFLHSAQPSRSNYEKSCMFTRANQRLAGRWVNRKSHDGDAFAAQTRTLDGDSNNRRLSRRLVLEYGTFENSTL